MSGDVTALERLHVAGKCRDKLFPRLQPQPPGTLKKNRQDPGAAGCGREGEARNLAEQPQPPMRETESRACVCA